MLFDLTILFLKLNFVFKQSKKFINIYSYIKNNKIN